MVTFFFFAIIKNKSRRAFNSITSFYKMSKMYKQLSVYTLRTGSSRGVCVGVGGQIIIMNHDVSNIN